MRTSAPASMRSVATSQMRRSPAARSCTQCSLALGRDEWFAYAPGVGSSTYGLFSLIASMTTGSPGTPST